MRTGVALLGTLASIMMLAAAPVAAGAERPGVTAPSEISSQNVRQRRARTRITVTPSRRAGKLVRECDFRLVREVRASGAYVVPWQHCWWTRQR
jgi:hypothetical protein